MEISIIWDYKEVYNKKITSKDVLKTLSLVLLISLMVVSAGDINAFPGSVEDVIRAYKTVH